MSEMCRTVAVDWTDVPVRSVGTYKDVEGRGRHSDLRTHPWRSLCAFRGSAKGVGTSTPAGWKKNPNLINGKTSADLGSECQVYCWLEELQQRVIIQPQLMASTQTQTCDTYPNMFEMESSSPPGGGWEIFLLLKKERKSERYWVPGIITCINWWEHKKRSPSTHTFSFNVSQKLFSPGGSAQLPVWGRLITSFASIHSENLNIFLPKDKYRWKKQSESC